MPNPATSQLRLACTEGDVQGADQALASGAKVNAYDDQGQAAVHLAAASGSIPLLQRLAQAPGFKVDRGRETDGSTALHCTCEDGCSIEVAAALLECGASPDAENLDGCTPLHFAAHMGARQHAQLLIQHGAKADPVNNAGQTPLLMAAEACGTQWVDRQVDYPGVVQVLLEAGANPDATDPCGDTALHMSLKARAAPIVAVLCSKGVNVNQRSGRLSGCCPPLHIACAVGDVDCLKLLLDAGADITAAEAEAGMTALHVASQAGQLSAVQALLAAGARADAPCTSGLTPLHLAAQEGQCDVLASLLNSTAVEAPTGGAEHAAALPSPLHMACHGGHLEAAQLLVQHQHNVCAVDGQLNTALHLAYRTGQQVIVDWLLSLPAGKEAATMRNAQGKLPAECAATS